LEGEKPHPANYQCCCHAKEELQKKSTQTAPKDTPGRVFSSNRTSPGVSFAAALRGIAKRVLQEPQELSAAQQAAEEQSAPTPAQSRQSGRAQKANSQPLDDMMQLVTVAQQIMNELNGAVSEEDKLVAITKIVLNLMKQNGH
jgi:hypothetical protein